MAIERKDFDEQKDCYKIFTREVTERITNGEKMRKLITSKQKGKAGSDL